MSRYNGRIESASPRWYPIGEERLQLTADRHHIEAGPAVRFRRIARGAKGDFERNPVHFLIASADLADLNHMELPTHPAGELRFACGMGMYRGMIVVH